MLVLESDLLTVVNWLIKSGFGFSNLVDVTSFAWDVVYELPFYNKPKVSIRNRLVSGQTLRA